MSSRLGRHICCIHGIILAGALSTHSLRAQQGTPIVLAPNTTISLPTGWKILSQAPDVATQPGRVASTDPQAATLLLTAAPADAKRNISLSLFHTHFHGWGPPLDAGNMGTEAEVEKILPAVLAQGFTPTSTRVAQSISSQNTRLITIEINAKNATGEERIFSDTVVMGQPYSTLRLYASRPASDPTGAQEIASIIQSFNAGPTAATGVVPASASVPAGPATTAPVVPVPPTTQIAAPAAAPAAPSGAQPAAVQSGQLINDYHGALILVEGQKGVGSGFLCNLGGHTFAVTNAHVLSDNIGIKLTTLDGKVLTAGASAVAVGHDIVKLEVTGAPKAFEVMTNVDSNVKIGDAVMVLGNAEGARVVKPVEGKVVGLGPDLIEVDAPFVKGNSGSPIIHVATGKVLGVATYLLQHKVNQAQGGGVTVETRRFGFRIDNVTQWEPINWQAFFAQSAQVSQIELLSEDFIKMSEDLRTVHHLVPDNYQSPALKRSMRTFLDEANHSGLSRATQNDILRRFFADLRTLTRSDILGFNNRNAYDYFKHEVQEQGRFRDELYEEFSRLMQNHM